MTEELRLEMVARQTEIGNLSDRLAERTAGEQSVVAARDGLADELAAERARLAGEQARLQALEAGFDVLQTERTGRLADLERRAAEVRSLEAAIASERTGRQELAAEVDGIRADRARLVAELAERGSEIARLTAELGDSGRRHDELVARLEAAETELGATQLQGRVAAAAGGAGGDNLRKALAATEAEKGELALRLAALEDDLGALRAENADLRRVAGAEWESDREESRRLRERLNEIAAGVVRLTQSLEGNGGAAKDDDGPGAPIPLAPVAQTYDRGALTMPCRRPLQQRVSRHQGTEQ
jgi:chromosome segregation ATPase